MSEEMGGLFGDPESPSQGKPSVPVPVPAPVAAPMTAPPTAIGKEEEKAPKDAPETLTTEPDRKLAFLAKIEKIEPIKKSETLEIATILGWTVVVKKGQFKPGELVIYFTIGAVPDSGNPAFDYLKVKGVMPELKSRKVKGALSQGAVAPLETLKYYGVDPATVKLGDDLSTQMKVMKGISEEEKDVYAKDLPEQEPFPEFIPQTDEERVQNIPDVVKEIAGLNIVVTRKEDGTSATFAYKDKRVYVCSRNNVWNKKCKPSSQVYMIFEKYKLNEGLKKLGRNIGIQGEIVGPGLMSNRLGLKDKEFRVFNIFDIDEQVFMTWAETVEICKTLGLQTVPLIYTGITPKEWQTVEDVLKYAESLEYSPGQPAEGMVIKAEMGKKAKRISFKAVSNKYIIKP